ncbi:unnamed protein product, partial [Allacma fusca]
DILQNIKTLILHDGEFDSLPVGELNPVTADAATSRKSSNRQILEEKNCLEDIHTKEVWENRLTAGCQELGYIPKGSDFLEALARTEIYLDRKSLSNLAIWEPRTFKCLNMVAATKAKQEGLNKFELGPPPQGIYTRGKL